MKARRMLQYVWNNCLCCDCSFSGPCSERLMLAGSLVKLIVTLRTLLSAIYVIKMLWFCYELIYGCYKSVCNKIKWNWNLQKDLQGKRTRKTVTLNINQFWKWMSSGGNDTMLSGGKVRMVQRSLPLHLQMRQTEVQVLQKRKKELGLWDIE